MYNYYHNNIYHIIKKIIIYLNITFTLPISIFVSTQIYDNNNNIYNIYIYVYCLSVLLNIETFLNNLLFMITQIRLYYDSDTK